MKNLLSFILGGSIGFSAVLYFVFFPEPWSIRSALIIVASIIASLLLCILLHECGHLFTGLTQGMQLLNLSVGPFVIERHEGKFHVHVVPSVLGYLGRAMMAFPKPLDDKTMRRKLIRYIYGGPMTNIVLGALSLVLAFTVVHNPFFLIFGLLNFLLGFMNLKPAMAGSVMTDGLVIQKLKSEKPADYAVLLTGYVMLTEGLKTEDVKKWSLALIENLEELVSSEDPMSKVYLQTISYYYLPNEPGKVMSIAKPVAFNKDIEKPDYYTDIADITYATTLYFGNEISDYPEIELHLQRISKLDGIIDLKRNALLSYVKGDTTKTIQFLQEAKNALGVWHPLYLRGEMEKRLIDTMIEAVESPIS